MKKISKIALLALFAASSFKSSAQSFNISGGLNLSNYSFFVDGEKMYKNDVEEFVHFEGITTTKTDAKINTGFNASIGYEFKLSKLFSIETGLMYSTKGYKLVREETYVWNTETETVISKDLFRINYLDLPIALNIGINTGDIRIYGKIGAYLGLGMLANVKTNFEHTDYSGASYTGEERYGFDLGDAENRLNYGVIGGLGAEYNNLFIEFKYSLGDVSMFDNDNYKIVSHNLGASIGYKFKKISK